MWLDRLRRKFADKRGRSDSIGLAVSIFSASSISGFVYWFGNGQLYLSHWNAQLAASIRESQWLVSRTVFGVFWSPLEGLGQRSLESPSWMNPIYVHMLLTGGRFSETYYGITLGSLIFLSAYWVSRRLGNELITSVLAAMFTLFVLFLPSPFLWQRQAGQSGVLIILPAMLSSALALAISCHAEYRARLLNLFLFGSAVFVFAYILGTGISLLLIPLITVWPVSSARYLIRNSEQRVWILLKSITFVFAILPQISSPLSFIALHRQSEQIGPVVGTFGELVREYWGDLGAVFPWYRWIVVATLALVFMCGWVSRETRQLALVGTTAFAFPIFVSVLGVLAVQLGRREILPSSNYFLIALIPVIVCSAAGIARHHLLLVLTRVRVVAPKCSSYVLCCLVVLPFMMWVLVWSIDNRGLRDSGASLDGLRARTEEVVAPILRELDCTLDTFRDELQHATFCGRVLLIDSEKQTAEGEPRRDPLWIAGLYESLSLHGVPVVNSYGSRYSGPYYRFTNTAFSDGSQSIRAWVVYNQFNANVAKLFGVRVVIADRPIEELELTREFQFVGGDGTTHKLLQYRLSNSNNNGVAVTALNESTSFAAIIEGLSSATPGTAFVFPEDNPPIGMGVLTTPTSFSMNLGSSTLRLQGSSLGQSLVQLPFEFSSCLSISPELPSDARLIRVNGIQLAVLFGGSLDATVELRDRGLGLRSCWAGDLLTSSKLE